MRKLSEKEKFVIRESERLFDARRKNLETIRQNTAFLLTGTGIFIGLIFNIKNGLTLFSLDGLTILSLLTSVSLCLLTLYRDQGGFLWPEKIRERPGKEVDFSYIITEYDEILSSAYFSEIKKAAHFQAAITFFAFGVAVFCIDLFLKPILPNNGIDYQIGLIAYLFVFLWYYSDLKKTRK